MPIILSQRVEYESDYDDVPYSVYHFPRRYINQIGVGNRFIYYQGNRHKQEHRYYFGCGVVGDIVTTPSGGSFLAKIIDGRPFSKKVPIYEPDGGGYIESRGFDSVRRSERPPWQNSIRPISTEAFNAILDFAKTPRSISKITAAIECADQLESIRRLNKHYSTLEPEIRARRVELHLDRGKSVTDCLKNLLGGECQVCGEKGFQKKDGTTYVESHHLTQVATLQPGILCSDNIVLLCANCHREIHYGAEVEVSADHEYIFVRLSRYEARIRRNTIEYLESIYQSRQ
ncbi:MAG: HNH endonuclease [Planctomycetota bacterium]